MRGAAGAVRAWRRCCRGRAAAHPQSRLLLLHTMGSRAFVLPSLDTKPHPLPRSRSGASSVSSTLIREGGQTKWTRADYVGLD